MCFTLEQDSIYRTVILNNQMMKSNRRNKKLEKGTIERLKKTLCHTVLFLSQKAIQLYLKLVTLVLTSVGLGIRVTTV